MTMRVLSLLLLAASATAFVPLHYQPFGVRLGTVLQAEIREASDKAEGTFSKLFLSLSLIYISHQLIQIVLLTV